MKKKDSGPKSLVRTRTVVLAVGSPVVVETPVVVGNRVVVVAPMKVERAGACTAEQGAAWPEVPTTLPELQRLPAAELVMAVPLTQSQAWAESRLNRPTHQRSQKFRLALRGRAAAQLNRSRAKVSVEARWPPASRWESIWSHSADFSKAFYLSGLI